MRCISLLIIPMYCGKSGRGVLKAVVLTYVVAGPITNMCLNAKEVVREFACSNELSHNISKAKYELVEKPVRRTANDLENEVGQFKDTISSIDIVIGPLEDEIEGTDEEYQSRVENDYIDDLFSTSRSSDSRIHNVIKTYSENDYYLKKYISKLEYRCENQLSRAVIVCLKAMSKAYDRCSQVTPEYAGWLLCSSVRTPYICNIMRNIRLKNTCDSAKQVDLGLSDGFNALKQIKCIFVNNSKNIKVQYKDTYEYEVNDIQDAKETGARVTHAFEEKISIMGTGTIVINVCMALLFLRIFSAAISYHDMYLTHIDYDNLYVTGCFKQLDDRRKAKNKLALLPLKKMERLKYIDVYSVAYTQERSKLYTQILKLMLEMITATTFVMLDRLFYEALDVVHRHAEMDATLPGMRDLNIEVEGTGILAGLIRKLLNNFNDLCFQKINNSECIPRPRLMPPIYFLKIYGGYLWILLLLYVNPYTLRLRRLICSYFYPLREKHRILHLYNDILKKRMKINKTFRRKAVQAVRAHYLSGENMLSLRMKFPEFLGWLTIFSAARMTCLICGETEPRKMKTEQWHSCHVTKCPFVYCAECWSEIGARCLACDPSLVELSDIDSLSEDEHPRY
ncbi:protein sneaky isoform X2 [Manduca sexta]|nr:protein sneaky isoform X2 [Manduca sexta]